MALKPLGDRIVVKALAAEEKSAGGILLPDSAQVKPQQGEVIAVGPGKQLDNGKMSPMDVEVGNVIYYAKYGGTEVKVGAEEYVILRQDDVLAIVEK
jgi:chaperonin GroES